MPADQQPDRPKLVAGLGDRDAPGEENPGARPGAGPERRMDASSEDAGSEDGGGKKRRGRLLPVLLVLLVLAGFAGLVWYAYIWGIGGIEPQELPLIQAEPGPVKSRPESPGGLEVPHQDKLVLNEIQPDPEKPQVERLLPPLEIPKPPQPVAAPEIRPPPAPLAPPADEVTEPPSAAEPPPETEPAPSAAERTPTPPPEAEAIPAPPEAEAKPAPEATPPKPAEEPQTAAAPPAGAYVVQLASLKERAGVEPAWARLQKAFPSLLGDRQLSVQSVDLGNRGTFHRVRAGFFPDRAAADKLCARLKAKKQDCLVAER